jgi:hypothetical protein
MQNYLILIIYILGVLPEYYRVRQANFLFHMAFHIQKRNLACRTLYNLAYRNMSVLLIIQKKMHVDAWITKNRFNPQLSYFQPIY